MIGLDTNVLVQLLTGDDIRLQTMALDYIERTCSAENPAYVNRVVVVEVVWVLESVYDYSRLQIADALMRVLQTAELRIEDADAASAALAAYRSGADFADAMLVATNSSSGCRATATFDRRATKRLRGFELIS